MMKVVFVYKQCNSFSFQIWFLWTIVQSNN